MQQQQPFFKMSNNSHYFSLEKFSSHFGHEPKSSAPKQASQNFFKQPSAKMKEIDTEVAKHEQHSVLEITGTEKMSGLYSRIHQEAEKLQKWKAAVVSELKQKDQQLDEANTNNELLRKSLVDLQVENENLSSSLQNEKLAHQEMRQQIHTTRNMCIALKDHVARVEATIDQGEVDKEELKHNEQQIIDTYQELAEQFKQLQLHSTSEQEHLTLQVEEQKKQNVCLITEHESTIKAANQKIQSLVVEVTNQKTTTEQLQKEIDHKSSQCVELKESLGTVQQELQSLKQENESKTTQLNTAMEDLNATLCDKKHMQDDLDQLKSVVNQTETQLKDQKNLLTIKEQCIYQLEEQVNHFKAAVKETANRLELSENHLAGDKVTIVDLRSSISLLQESVERYKNEMQSIKNDKELLSAQLRKAQDELKQVKECMNKEQSKLLNEKALVEDERQVLRENLKVCHTMNEKYTQQLILMKEIVKKKEAELSEVAKKSRDSVDLICVKLWETLQHAAAASLENVDEKCPITMNALIDKNITILYNQLKESQSVNKSLINKNREMEKTSEELKESLDDVNIKLKQQEQLLADNEKTGISNVKSLEKEIKSHSKQINTLTSKNSKLQMQLDAKLQTINDLKSEVKKHRDNLKDTEKSALLLKKQLGDNIREKDELLSQYTEEIQQLKEELTKASESVIKIKEKETQLRSELDNTTKLLYNAENEARKCKEQSQVHQRQQKEDKIRFDQEMSEMCATLEKYKAENQRMLCQKDKEIEVLREYQNKNTIAVEESHRLEAEILRLKSIVENISQEKDLAIKEHKSTMTLVENLRKQLNEKNCQLVESLQVAKLPLSVASTPQPPTSRGILKQFSSSKSGSKRVAFVSSGSDQSDAETDVLKENIAVQASNNQRTPVRANELSKLKLTPSPNVRIAPSLRNQQKSGTAIRKFTSSAKKACVTPVSDSEMSQFKELFPNYCITDKSKETKVGLKRNTNSNDLKSTPTKSFKYSSLSITKKGPSRAGKRGTNSKQPDMSWFEIDPIFGFTAED